MYLSFYKNGTVVQVKEYVHGTHFLQGQIAADE
jgi:hypothetical protein